MLDLAALMGAAAPESVAKAEESEAFGKLVEELEAATEAAVGAKQRLKLAERAMATMARGFFSKREIKEAKWD